MPGVTAGNSGVDQGQLVVGIADLIVSNDPTATIRTYALGSCIGITAYDGETKVGGLLHFMLPKPPEDGGDEDRPCMYATRAIPTMVDQLEARGADPKKLVICAAGAAEILQDGGFFAIGKRNRTIMRKILWRKNLVLTAEDTGGCQARTMSLNMATGEVSIRIVGEGRVLWST